MKTARTLLSALAIATLGTATFVQAASIIVRPISAVDNGHYSDGTNASDATKTIDGSILSNPSLVNTGDPIPASYPTTTAGPSPASFFSNYAILQLSDDPSGPATPLITYTLAGPSDPGFKLTGGHFWQYSGDHEPSGGERSLVSAEIFVSTDGVGYVDAGTLLPGYVEGAIGTLDAGVDFAQNGAFTGIRSVELRNLTALGDHDVRVAFNEIRFFAATVPEPASLGLLILGATGLVARRRSAR